VEPLRYLSRRRTLAGLPYRVLEALTERRLTWQLRHLRYLDSAVRAADPVHLYEHPRSEFHARQIPHLALAHLARHLQFPTASRADQLPVAAFPPYPKLQGLRPF